MLLSELISWVAINSVKAVLLPQLKGEFAVGRHSGAAQSCCFRLHASQRGYALAQKVARCFRGAQGLLRVPENTRERKRKGGDGKHAAHHQNNKYGSAQKPLPCLDR